MAPILPYVVFLIFTFGCINAEVVGSSSGAQEKDSRSIFRNGPCSYDQFRCTNDVCVSKSQFCNGRNDCGDNSDEEYCRVSGCPAEPPRMRCYHHNYYRCIPNSWMCDGQRDCASGADETNCVIDENSLSLSRISSAKQRAIRWIIQGRDNESLSHKWGLEVTRKAIAWYLGDQDNFFSNKTFMSEMAYEVSLSLLSRIATKRLKEIPSTELASYVNVFLVTCVDPRRFYDMDLVKELRGRVDASNETHPAVMLALCNAGDLLSDRDVAKTTDAFWRAHKNFRTDVEALAVLALSCAVSRDPKALDVDDISELTAELKKKQYRNGTVESLKTTALVMQALYASERESDGDNFDEEKALKQILKSQSSDDSFGNMANTYYVLPVFAYRSLVNISSSHCAPRPKNENDRLNDLLNLGGQKSRVRYSLWIGNNRTVERTITLKVPANTSLYGTMEWAAGIDPQFRFEYSMRERKPYIYSISGIQDDPENSMFWFLHSIGSAAGDKVTPIEQSPADVVPKNGQHLVFWYKCG